MLSDCCLSICLSVFMPVCDDGVLWPNGCMNGWIRMPLDMEVGLGPGHIVLDGDPAPRLKGTHLDFRPTFVLAKRLDGSSCHLVRR